MASDWPGLPARINGGRTSRLQLRCQLRNRGGISFVSRTDNRDPGIARGKFRYRVCDVGLRFPRQHLEAADLKKIRRIGFACDLLGDAANTGEEDTRAVTVATRERLRGIPKLLECIVVGMHRERSHHRRLTAFRHQLLGDLSERGTHLGRGDRSRGEQAAPGSHTGQCVEHRRAGMLLPPVRQAVRGHDRELAIVGLLLLGAMLGQCRMLAHAGHRHLARGDVLLARSFGGLDLLRHPAVYDRFDHAALSLDLPEDLPGASGDFVGIPLDVPGPAGGIDHLWQMAFLGEDELCVARIAPTYLRRKAGWSVERRGGDNIGSSHRASIAGDSVAQNVE